MTVNLRLIVDGKPVASGTVVGTKSKLADLAAAVVAKIEELAVSSTGLAKPLGM